MKAWCVYIKEQDDDDDVWSSCVFANNKSEALAAWYAAWGKECCCGINDIAAIRKPKFDDLCDKVDVIDSPHDIDGIESFWDAE